MSSVKARKYVLRSQFSGPAKREDLEIVEEELPPLKDGEFLCEAQWLSVDPYMRLVGGSIPVGSTMIGTQVAKVVASKLSGYSKGDLVVGDFGWRTHTISNGKAKNMLQIEYDVPKVDPSIPLSPSTALGVVGMPGATAYFGVLELLQSKEGETLLVNGAAGAVGSLVGQIAKIKGCRVVGFAGSDKKVEYLKSIGFDAAYNYKTVPSLDAAIKEACPNGVNMFFDNVGGEFFEVALSNMALFGRVAVCGAISEYNATEPGKGHYVSGLILSHQLKIQGFEVYDWLSEWPTAHKELAKWINEGKLTYREHITEGFDKMYDAFMELFSGANIGKALVKA